MACEVDASELPKHHQSPRRESDSALSFTSPWHPLRQLRVTPELLAFVERAAGIETGAPADGAEEAVAAEAETGEEVVGKEEVDDAGLAEEGEEVDEVCGSAHRGDASESVPYSNASFSYHPAASLPPLPAFVLLGYYTGRGRVGSYPHRVRPRTRCQETRPRQPPPRFPRRLSLPPVPLRIDGMLLVA